MVTILGKKVLGIQFLNKKKMKISVVINTYQRKDGSTPHYLRRALDSVFNQTHQDFKIFIIGDKYENDLEFREIFSKYDNKKLYFENLPFAKERDVYTNKFAIWSYAGCYSYNYGIEKAIEDGFEYVCHLDHDDEWYPNHLEELVKVIKIYNPLWICTKSEYVGNRILPIVHTEEEVIPFLPIPEGLIHSSVCMNLKSIPLRYRDLYAETGKIGLPGDADMWVRVRDYLTSIKQHGLLINKITCKHKEEGYERN